MVDGIIDDNTYTSSKKDFDKKLLKLKGQLFQLGGEDNDIRDFVQFGTNLLTNIHYFYSKSSVVLKQKLLSSILKGKLIFNGEKYLAAIFNDAISFICGSVKALQGMKIKRGNTLSNISPQVVRRGIEPLLPG